MAKIPSPLERLHLPEFDADELEVWVKRDDLIHPHIMGNKWRKLKYNIEEAKAQQKGQLVTFGGAYSNHIAATAASAKENALEAMGIIRGDELHPDSNPTLRFASAQGMKLQFVSREAYRLLKQNPASLEDQYPEAYLLPEGGTNHLAIDGCTEIIGEIDLAFDYIIAALGTGGTLAGLVKGMDGYGKVVGVSSLKGSFVHQEFESLLTSNHIVHRNYQLLDQFHFGGYGKVKDELIHFINDFKNRTGIPLDPIYTGKMGYAFMQLIKDGFFGKKRKIVLLHTGGLQGIAGFLEKRGENLMD